MKEFVAITDELFYSHPELYDHLVPFTHDIACRHLLRQPLDIEGYADIIEYSIVGQPEMAATGAGVTGSNDSFTSALAKEDAPADVFHAQNLHTESEVQACNAH